MGTSLTVHPFASLTQLVPEGCPRVLINIDRAGDIGTRADDVLLLGKADEVVRELCEALGEDWVEELDAMWKETEKYGRKTDETEEEAAEVKKDTKVTEKDVIAQAKAVQDEVDKLTAEVEKALKIGHVPSNDDKEDAPAPVASQKTGDAAGDTQRADAKDEGEVGDTEESKPTSNNTGEQKLSGGKL